MALESMAQRLEDLARRSSAALMAGGEEQLRRQHGRGKMTARERVSCLLDPGSFSEVDMLARSRSEAVPAGKRAYTDGVVTGVGTVEGRKICVYSQDFTVAGGTLGEVSGEKIWKIMDLAVSLGVPLVGINDGGGARVQEGVVALHYYGGIFRRNVAASGLVPQVSVIMGSCAGGAVYSPAITDFVFMVQGTSQMFITGPDVVRAVTGEDVTLEQLGGALTHASKSGVAAFVAPDERTCLQKVRQLLGFLPPNNLEAPPVAACPEGATADLPGLARLVPASLHEPYDIRSLARAVLDGASFFEYHALWAPNLVCGFGRLGGRVVGIVANQPLVLGGVLDIDAAEKGARFVRTCDCFNIPVVTFVDVGGFMPGTGQEHAGLARRAAKLLYAYCEAAVPKIQLVLRRAYGAAYVAMCSKALGASRAYAWPGAQVAVMGPGPHAARAGAGSGPAPGPTPALGSAFAAAGRGYIDEVIEPASTRRVLYEALSALAGPGGRSANQPLPARKHGNLPL